MPKPKTALEKQSYEKGRDYQGAVVIAVVQSELTSSDKEAVSRMVPQSVRYDQYEAFVTILNSENMDFTKISLIKSLFGVREARAVAAAALATRKVVRR